MKLNLALVKTIQVNTIILDSSSDTSPSATSLSTSTESQITNTTKEPIMINKKTYHKKTYTQTRNVTPVTPSKIPKEQDHK